VRPHVLFVIADDHRYGAIRAQGDPALQTPALVGLKTIA
jgi:arylsulfatase A-like enzyme